MKELSFSKASRYSSRMTIAKELRRIIDSSGLSRYELAKLSGVTEGTLSKCMAGADVTTRTLDALAPVLGLRLVVDRRVRRSATNDKRPTKKGGR